MTPHDRLVFILIAQYVVLCCAAAYGGQWGKAVYWLGATVISIGVLMQR